ncbi:putative adds multiple copies of isopentenyl pyrophosphate (IPP) to farnesyl pyrophosphate (FPP) to produce dehydrodolichyl diphosphate (Dedol-PP), a precursor of dolichol which is utilized as a sugar carrier in protein glycosylation in the endoplasmic reticulum (ER) [Lyophyllum shimeji]|uniref:Alkyl transferase n=1 Tax=Lyophyllum shimeji TaxID=47721 RepID=A0A9P3PT98_LYOSH|nr:putative adds multiple copies of isopentenyl pyrophosphate (IPP) to farnesyl pyrophosphate (FPP) to produce dehydrodolichyl diphosphate (Dedol-PP), a precursor of dolichol which is utilized as a sugar carrier in protein glycosylation in the endoplasmic reticulum (ER) [Lyophyllum shimeji]
MFLRALRWLRRKVADRAQRLLLTVLAAGPIPRHVAFVMDGNRRYARSHRKRPTEGHLEGFQALRRMLEICFVLDIRCVSAFAFSIENFKRSPEEVDTLMGIAEEKLLELCQHGDLLNKYGVRLNVVGNVGLLPKPVQKAARKAENMTRHNKRRVAIFNLCMPYTSRDEMTTAVQTCVQNAMASDSPETPIITEHDIDRALLTSKGGSPPLDILVRTSGVKRLSDFLLWQCCENTQIQFADAYWPDFGLFDLIPIILDYQRKVWSR